MNSPLTRAAVCLSVAAAAGCGPAVSRPENPATHPVSTPAPPVVSPHPDDDGVGIAPSARPADAAMRAAQAYVQMWARPHLDRDAWYNGVCPLVTPAYGRLLADTDPAHVPAHLITGGPRPVSSTTAVLVADVPTDAGPIRVTAVNTAGRWLIASTSPASTS